MQTANLIAWALRVMHALQPTAPYADTFEASAAVIVRVAESEPLYPVEKDGIRRTVALVLSLGNFEGALKQDAEGDCRDGDKTASGLCKKGASGRSKCMLQVNESNFKALGITAKQIQTDFEVCVRAAFKMIRASFSICRQRAPEDKLANYAAGGEGCGGPKGEGIMESRHRVRKAQYLYDQKVFLEGLEESARPGGP